jgi:hypothetical protein
MASSFVAALSSVTAVAFSFVASLLARSAQDLYKGLFGSFLESIDVLVGQAPKRHRTVDTAYRLPVPTPSQVAKERALARIEEAKDAFRSQTSSAKWSKVSGNLLAVGQYIIGGLLREFIRAGVPLPEARRFSWTARAPRLPHQAILCPEVSVENARKKVAQLKALIRTSEDQLAILDAKIASGQDHTYAMISLLTKITDRLTEIETPEVIEQRPEPPEKSA